MFSYHGKTALITGASSGIGLEFARTLAAKGTHLVLVARSKDKLEALANELSTEHAIQAHVIVADLSLPGAAKQVYSETQQGEITVDILINNAGFGTYGTFEALEVERQSNEIMLNVMTLVELTHAFLPAMQERGYGAILNVASTAAFQPTPYMAVYGATKAFVLSFSEALWAENKKHGVNVLAVCPGPTETSFFDVAGSDEFAVGGIDTPENVVRKALQALDKGNSFVIPKAKVYTLAQLNRFVPRSWAARIAEQLLRPRKKAQQHHRDTLDM